MKQNMKFFLPNSVISLVCMLLYNFGSFFFVMMMCEGGYGHLGAGIFFVAANVVCFVAGRYFLRREQGVLRNILSVLAGPLAAEAVLLLVSLCLSAPFYAQGILFSGSLPATLMTLLLEHTEWSDTAITAMEIVAYILGLLLPYVLLCGGLLMREEDA